MNCKSFSSRLIRKFGFVLIGLIGAFSISAYADNSFRITEYHLTSSSFTGATVELTLNQNLRPNHIILVRGGADGNTTRGADDNYARVYQLPAGINGELGTSSGADRIGLQRYATDGNWIGVVTVIESMGDGTISGFKLLDVLDLTTSGTDVAGTDTSGTAWSNINRVVLFGAAFGAGSNVQAADASAYYHTSAWLNLYPSGTDTINWARVDGGGRGLQDAVHTIYVVEFGSQWTIQYVNVTGSAGGNGTNSTGDYDTGAITGVERNNTWVWGTGTSSDDGIGDGAEAVLVTLGDGVDDTPGTKSTVAVGMENTDSRSFDVYTFTHPNLAVDYRFKSDGDNTALTYDMTVDNSTNNVRMGWITNGTNGTGNAFPRPIFSARYTSNTNVQVERGYNGQAWPAWIQAIDYSGITFTPSPDRYWVSSSSGNWNDANNWSFVSGGEGGFSVPVSTTSVFFDANRIGDAYIEGSAVTVASLTVVGYTGTINLNNNLTVTSQIILSSGTISHGTGTVTVSTFAINATGSFEGGSGNIAITSMTLNGGSFEASSSTTQFSSSFIMNGGTYDGATGINIFDSPINITNGNFTATSSTMQVTSTFTHTGGTFSGGTGTVHIISTGTRTLNIFSGTTFNNLVIDHGLGGLVGYWKFDDGFGTQTNVTAKDSSGLGKNGTLINMDADNTDWLSGSPNTNFGNPGSLLMDDEGTNGYVEVQNPNLPTGDFTYAGWVYLNANSDEMIFMSGNTSGQNEFFLWVSGGNLTTYIDNAAAASSAGTVPTGAWTHVAVTRSGSAVQLYINGSPDGSGTNGNTLDFTSCQLLIGADTDSGCATTTNNWLTGQVDELRIYSRGLSATEISNLANGDNPYAGYAELTIDDNLDVNGNLTILSGSLNSNGQNVSVGGDWNDFGGDFDEGSGLVTFDGSSAQSIYTDENFYDLSISKSGTLSLASDLFIDHSLALDGGVLSTSGSSYAINISGDWDDNSGSFTANNSTVTFYGSGTSVITGDTTFSGLKAVTSGKQINFENGSNTSVTGSLQFENQTLRSTLQGSQWNINLSGTQQTAKSVSVRDSNAQSGNTIEADLASTNVGNNLNWSFGANERYWSSSTTGNWNDISNWSSVDGGPTGFSVPDITHTVYFNGTSGNNGNVNLNADVEIGVLNMNGYSGSMNSQGFAITISTGFIQNTGTINFGSSTVVIGDFNLTGGNLTATSNIMSIRGTANFTAGTFSDNGGTIQFGGESDATLTFGSGYFFNNVSMSNALGNGLVGYWKFDDGDGGGTNLTAADSSGLGKTGMLTNMDGDNTDWVSPTTATSFGNIHALHFADSGTSGHVRVANPNLPTGDFTYSGWFKFDSVADEALFMIADGTGANEFLIHVSGGNLRTWVNNSQNATASGSFGTGTWIHIAVTRSGSAVTQYIDGAVNGTGSDGNALSFSSCPLLIGIDADGGGDGCTNSLGNFFEGDADDLRVYDRALSLSEIQTLANGGQPGAYEASLTQSGNLDVNGNFSVGGGTYNANGNDINVVGDFLLSGGVFLPNLGEVIFDGASTSTISGSIDFYDLTATLPDTLIFGAGETVTVSNSINLQNVKLRSSSIGTEWLIDFNGVTQTLQSLDVQDSNASPGNTLVPDVNSFNRGNNTNWQFNGPNAITDLIANAGTDDVTLSLTWTAPGDDGSTGTLNNSTFSIQYTTIPVFNDWNPEVVLSSAPIIHIATSSVNPGTNQNHTLTGLFSHTTYYLRIWTRDDENNLSPLSNAATGAVLPNQIQIPANPFLLVQSNDVQVGWDALPVSPSSASSSGYILEASDQSDFSGIILSSKTYDVLETTLTVSGLVTQNTYYFRVGTLSTKEDKHYRNIGSTVTLESTDFLPPDPVTNLTGIGISATEIKLEWTAPFDPTNSPLTGNYYIQHATHTGVVWSTSNAQVAFATSNVNASAYQSRIIGGLVANTTHYIRIWTSDLNPNFSTESNLAAEPTLANIIGGIQFPNIQTSTITMTWNSFPASPQESSANGYVFNVSTSADANPIFYSSSTTNINNSTFTVTGLESNTTYYFQVGTLNIENSTNYATIVGTSTLASLITQATSDFLSAGENTITARWSAHPPTPSTATAEGYIVQASSTNFSGAGLTYSSRTTNISVTTLTVTNLEPNILYYFRVGSINWNGTANYKNISSTSTLTKVPTSVTATQAFENAMALSWITPLKGASGGYHVMASSTNFNGSGVIYSTQTASEAETSLIVSGLMSNTTHHFRVGGINASGNINYASAIATATLAQAPSTLPMDIIGAYSSSITANWVAMPASPPEDSSRGYALEASTASFGSGGTIFSSVTTNVSLSTLTVSGLTAAKTYFLRVGSLNWNNLRNYTALTSTSTLGDAPVSAASTYTFVGISSITAQWGAGSNPPGTEYTVEFSSVSNFNATVYSSVTFNQSGTGFSLTPNTSYYTRVKAAGSPYTSLGSTLTFAAPPTTVSQTFNPVNITSMTVSYGSGSPTNPSDTQYNLQLSTNSDYSNATTSITTNVSVQYTGLQINTSYYARVRAQSRLGAFTEYTILNATSTLAVTPGPVVSTFTSVTNKSISFTWSSGTVATGFNPSTTTYHAQISDDGSFASITAESFIEGISTTFSGLVSDTIYHVRVRALNQQTIPTNFVNFGSTQTTPSSLPVFLIGTFEVTDSQGSYINGETLYTDTTTPNIRVQVQSSKSPGLAVDRVPSQYGNYLMDEGSGSTVVDSSLHGLNLGLQGTPLPSWVGGLTGYALQFDGANNVAISPQSTPYRASDLPFTIEFWFKTTTNAGHMFEHSTSGSVGSSGTRDNQFSWLDADGNITWRLSGGGGTSDRITGTNSFADGNWHYVAGVVGSSQRWLYVDGQEEASATLGNLRNGDYYNWIGAGSNTNAGQGNGNRFFQGEIDMVRISTLAIGVEQIQANYQLGLTLGHKLRYPGIDVSTQAGGNFTWVALSTNAFSITGTIGTTAAQTFSGINLSLTETNTPSANTNQVMFIASDLDSGMTTKFYTILVDTTPPSNVNMSTLLNITTNSITATALNATDALSGLNSTPYLIQYATNSIFDIPVSSSGFIAITTHTFTSLVPNSTYFFRVQARDRAGIGNISPFSSSASSVTLAVPVQNINIQNLYLTSATLTWDALPSSPQGATSEGYILEASSTNFNGTGTALTISTNNVSGNTLTVEGLSVNTTYFFRVGSLNWHNNPNYTSGGSTSTLTNVVGSPSITNVFGTSVQVSWSIPTGNAEGYRVDASTQSNFADPLISSITTNGLITTLTVESLATNTTYFFRVGAQNWNGVYNYISVGSTSTLVNAPTSPIYTGVFISSVSMSWTGSVGGAAQYQLDASTNSDFSVPVISSATTGGNETNLTVVSLNPNTSYYFRVGALNWNEQKSFVSANSTSTLTHPPTSPNITSVNISSVSLNWTGSIGGVVQYRVDASTASNFTGTVISSQTTNGNEINLTVVSLSANTTYFFRVGGINHNNVLNYVTAGSTSTLTSGPVSPSFTNIFVSSISLSWSAPAGGAKNYRIHASTNADFSEPIISSQTSGGSELSLTVETLSPNTTYFVRVGAVNWNDYVAYTTVGTTSTLANPPGNPGIVSVYFSSITVNWTASVGGSNGYRLEASTNSNFGTPLISSVTTITSETQLVLGGLEANTTYFIRVGAPNWNNIISFAPSLSTATLAGAPENIAFTNVSISSVTLTWDAPAGGSSGYQLDASTSANFSGTLESSSTTNGNLTTLTVFNLSPNTTYFFRVGAINQSESVVYGSILSTSTLANYPLTAAFSNIFVSSITANWAIPTGGAAQFKLDASTSSNFSGTLISSVSINGSSTNLTTMGLDPNTTYYLRIGAVNWNNVPTYTFVGSTSTLSNPITRITPDILNVNESSITVRWAALPSVPQSASAESYLLLGSSTNFNGTGIIYSSSTTNMQQSTLTISGLTPNTTYHFRVGTLNWNNVANYVVLQATSTLAQKPVSPAFTSVNISSVSVSWTLPPNLTRGFILEANTESDYSGTAYSSATTNNSTTNLTVVGLTSDTTYYFRVGSINWNENINYAILGGTTTRLSFDPTPPNAITNLTATNQSDTEMNLTWTAPLDPTNNPLSGQYIIQYTTSTGATISTTNAQIFISTSNVSPGQNQHHLVGGLNANTTHYFYIWTEDTRPNTSPLSNGTTRATLAVVPENIQFGSIFESSATLTWTALPPTPQSATSEGYILQASTASNFSGTVLSSSTNNFSNNSLVVSGLSRNTTYYFRAGSLNWAGTANYATAVATSTLTIPPTRSSTDFIGIYTTSATVRWIALPSAPQVLTSEGYLLQASSTNFNGTGTVYSSATTQVNASTLTLTGLSINTTYFYKVGSLNWNNVANFVALNSSSTLAIIPSTTTPTFPLVAQTTVTAQWLPNGNSALTQYSLQFSTASNFSGVLFTSTTYNSSATITGLTVSTTYYGRVRAINHNNIPTAYLSLGLTRSLASPPLATSPTFNPVRITSTTVNYVNGSPPNPAGTAYTIEISTDSGFGLVTSSITANYSASYIGLKPNTTYYARGRANNGSGSFSAYTDFGSTVTLAAQPSFVTPTFTAIGPRSFTANWSSGTAAIGYNVTGTTYTIQISTGAGFSPILSAFDTISLNQTFSGLEPGSTYYARVQAINFLGIGTAFYSLGSVATTPSSEPIFFDATFQITNSSGTYINSSLYTDTTTINARVDVQSKYAPGLAVNKTAAFVALWHLDEGTGSTSVDSSLNNKTLTLNGAPLPTWTSGRIDRGLDFDGSQNYAVTPTLFPWRNATNTNSWTVEFWFKTSSNVGYLFQVANAAAPSASAFDASIGWHSTSGNLTFEVRRNSGGTQYMATAAQSYADGNWHFVAARLNATAMTLYVDGTNVASNTGVTASLARRYTSAIYAWIGAANTLTSNVGNGSRFSNADIDEVRISSVAYSDAQIRQHYALTGTRGEGFGGPAIDISTQAGNGFTWVRRSTNTTSITGSNGTTAIQTFTGTSISVVESTGLGAPTNQITFLATALDGTLTTAQYKILVDTSPPTNVGINNLTSITTGSITVNLLTAIDSASGLATNPYLIQASTASNFSVIHSSSNFIAGPSHVFGNLNANTTYYFRVRAIDNTGWSSAYSSGVSTKTLDLPPAAITNLAGTQGQTGGSINLTWTSPGEDGLIGTLINSTFTIQYTTDTAFNTWSATSTYPAHVYRLNLATTSVNPGSTHSTSLTGLQSGATYYLRAWTKDFNGNYSNISNSTSTWATVINLSLSLSTDTLNLGSLLPGATVVHASSITITNDGNVTEKVQLAIINPTIWTATNTASGIDTFRLTGVFKSTAPSTNDFSITNDVITTSSVTASSTIFAVDSDPDSEKGIQIPPGESRALWIRIEMPPISSTTDNQIIRINATAVKD